MIQRVLSSACALLAVFVILTGCKSDPKSACEPTPEAELCADHAATCGSLTVSDGCGASRTVQCGACAGGVTCNGNTCGGAACTPESDNALCSRVAAQCDSLSVRDTCGTMRSVASCGRCGADAHCDRNSCVVGACMAESEAELCAASNRTCGALSAKDRCGASRSVTCGACAADQMCGAETGKCVSVKLVAVPNLVGQDLQAAGDTLSLIKLKLPQPIDVKVVSDDGPITDTRGFVVVRKVSDPPVQVLSQNPPAGAMAPEGTEIALKVTVPPDSNHFLTDPNIKQTLDTEASADAYYDTIDEQKKRTTLDDWKRTNGFDKPHTAEEKASAVYQNTTDLGFGRRMFMVRDGRNVAFYVQNYPTLPDAIAERGLIASVAMEYSPNENAANTTRPFTKFYTFDANGRRISNPALDTRGPKFQPGVCQSCHGGHSNPAITQDLTLEHQNRYINDGDTSSRFIPFDIDLMHFADQPGLRRADQEAEIKKLNEAVQRTYARSYRYSGSSFQIPDNGTAVELPIMVTGEGGIRGLTVTLGEGNDPGIEHDNVSDLTVELISPAGTVLPLTARIPFTARNFSRVMWDDTGTKTLSTAVPTDAPFEGLWLPDLTFSTLFNESANGNWKLRVQDHHSGVMGKISGWQIHFAEEPGRGALHARQLVDVWYGGVAHDKAFDSSFIPLGWQTTQQSRTLYKEVVAKSCRLCHAQLESRLDFASFTGFTSLNARHKHFVFEAANMPMSERSFYNFWLSYPSEPKLLTQVLNVPYSGPGRPVAIAAPPTSGRPGDLIQLDGSASIFAKSFTWSLLNGPSGSTITQANSDIAFFQASTPGTYTVRLEISDGLLGAQASVQVNVASASLSYAGANIAAVWSSASTNCVGCHNPNGIGKKLDLALPLTSCFANPADPACSTSLLAGNRINLASPGDSRLIRVPTRALATAAGVAHPIEVKPAALDLVLQWIQGGAQP